MSQIPAMPLYWDAYLADTTHLTTEEHGAYLLLLAAMWRRNATVPDDDKDLARITGLSVAKWRKVKDRLSQFLAIENGHISQKKLQKTWEICAEKIEKNRKNGAKGGRPKSSENNDLEKANGSPDEKPDKTIPEPEPEPIEKETDKEKSVSPAKGSRLPADWMPEPLTTDFLKRWPVTQEFCESQLEQFRDYWNGKPGAAGRKIDWQGTWRNWLRKGFEYQGGSPQNKSAQSNTISLLRGIMEDDDRNSETAPQDNFDRPGLLAPGERN